MSELPNHIINVLVHFSGFCARINAEQRVGVTVNSLTLILVGAGASHWIRETTASFRAVPTGGGGLTPQRKVREGGPNFSRGGPKCWNCETC